MLISIGLIRPDPAKRKKKEKEIRINLVSPTIMSADPRPTASQSLADFRLDFSPSYVLVGVYRLSTDAAIRVPVWKKCKDGFVRGVLAGLAWVSKRTQRPTATCTADRFPGVFHVRNSKELHPTLSVKVRPLPTIHHGVHSHPHARSARVTGLSDHSFFGYTVPFELTTCMRPLPILILTLQFIRLPSRCSARPRRSSKHHPQLLSAKEYSHCQEKGMGSNRCLARQRPILLETLC